MSNTHGTGNGPDLYATGNDSFEKIHDLKINRIARDIGLDTDSICHLFGSSMRGYKTLLLTLRLENLHSTLIATNLIPEVKDEFS
jgi:hypothetical protein